MTDCGDGDHGVRAATPADEPAIRRLQRLLPEPSPRLVSYGLAAGTVLVTTASDVSAQTSGESTAPPVGYLLAIHGEQTHLAEFVVAPEYRREGRASALLSELLAGRPDGERVTLAVAADNEPAKALYRTFGFERFDRSDEFFERGEALLFERVV